MFLSRFERMIARRYLLPGKGEGFIFLVAAISLVAVMLGVAALIIVMSVMNGFRAELFDKGFRLWQQQREDRKKVKPDFIPPRFVLLHSLAHLLITAVSLDCGYAASSIRASPWTCPQLPVGAWAARAVAMASSYQASTISGKP